MDPSPPYSPTNVRTNDRPNARSAGRSSAPTDDPLHDPTPEGAITVTVADAAKLLGLTSEAVRSRVKRGTLPSRRVAGTVYVLLDEPEWGSRAGALSADPSHDPPYRPSGSPTGGPSNARSEDQSDGGPRLVGLLEDHNESLKDEVEYLRGELRRREEAHAEESRRKDSIIMSLTQRVPELEAPPGPRDVPETASKGGAARGGALSEPQEPLRRRERGWWRRFFGFD